MYKKITSTDNRIYKLCGKLAHKKYRDKEDKYLIEGENLIFEAVSNGINIYSILLREDYKISLTFDIDENLIFTMPEKIFDSLAQTETSQGVLAIVEKPANGIENLMQSNKESSNYIVLDRLQDPGNIGTIIRTAEGAGYSGIVVLKGTSDIFSPKVVRAAAGSVFRIPIIFVEDNRELIKLVRQLEKKIVVTCFDTDRYYFNEELSQGICLVIGNEGNGISEELILAADIKVKIPMCGKLESLNAAVAAGIIMYEGMRDK